VPNVIGLTAAAAKQRLGDRLTAKFEAAADDPPSKEKELTVAAQDPAPGTRVPPNSVVVLRVYGSFSTTVQEVEVPSVLGLTAAAAKQKLEASKLGVQFVPADRKPPSKNEENTVAYQAPAAGKKVKARTVILVQLYGAYDDTQPKPPPTGFDGTFRGNLTADHTRGFPDYFVHLPKDATGPKLRIVSLKSSALTLVVRGKTAEVSPVTYQMSYTENGVPKTETFKLTFQVAEVWADGTVVGYVDASGTFFGQASNGKWRADREGDGYNLRLLVSSKFLNTHTYLWGREEASRRVRQFLPSWRLERTAK
jgi:hypothetical protein